MSGNNSSDEAGRRALNQIIAQYLQAVQAGDSPDRDRLLLEHPDFAEELKSFFADHDKLWKLARPDRGGTQGEKQTSAPESPTILPGRPPRDAAVNAPKSPYQDAVEETSPVRDAVMAGAVARQPGAPLGAKVRYFGDYELLEEIARGGMGVVYKARQMSLNRIVALKMILSGQLASEQDVKRFHVEAEAAANLDHPGIVPIYEVGQHEGQHYFSMAYVEAESLQQAAGERRLSPRDAAALTKDIADAISFAHQRGVIHRDLKPANILVGRDGRPRVTDFGLARRIRDDSALTAAGQILGTPSFMPPEQAAGKLDQVGPLSDLYSLGAVLYFQLTGRPPFQSASAVDTLFEVLEADLTPPRDLNRLVHPDLEAVCLKCLAKDPGDRYKSVADFAEDLQRYLAGEPVRARRYSALSRCVRWARRRPALAATWLALPVFYLNHLANVYILHLPGTGGTYHCVVTAIVLVWAVAAWCFQRLLLRPGWKTPAAYCWACTEVALFTCFLLVGDGPRSALVVGYPLLIAAAALRAGPRLVCTVAGLCVSGYVLVLADAVWNRRQLAAPPPVFVPFLLCLVFVAVIQCLLLRRTPLSSDSALRGPDAGAAASPRGQGPA